MRETATTMQQSPRVSTLSSPAGAGGIARPAPAGGPRLEPVTLDQWQEFVESRPESTIFHHRNWIELLVCQYRFALTILAVKTAGEIVAAIPLLETGQPWGEKKLVSLPFTDCVRALASTPAALAALRDALAAQRFDDYRSVILRTDQPLRPQAAASHWVHHEMSTAVPPEQVAARYSSNLRQNLRRAETSGLRFERRTDAAALDAFYRLHLQTRRKQGVPVQPRGYFHRIYEYILQRGLGFVGVVSKDETPVAAAVYLVYHRRMIYKYGASDIRALNLRPNEYLMAKAIRLAAEEGCASFDFGTTAKNNEGLCRYKRKWGAAETELYREYLWGEPPGPADGHLAFRATAYIIRHSPALVCRVIGEALYKYSQ